MLTDEQVEMEIKQARQADGMFSGEWVEKMNRYGIWLQFHESGVRWRRHPFNQEQER